MIHHSISHGALSVLSVMSADFLLRQVGQAWPLLNIMVSDLSMWLATHVPIGLGPTTWYRALVAMVLGLVWGGAFWFSTVRPAMREEQ